MENHEMLHLTIVLLAISVRKPGYAKHTYVLMTLFSRNNFKKYFTIGWRFAQMMTGNHMGDFVVFVFPDSTIQFETFY